MRGSCRSSSNGLTTKPALRCSAEYCCRGRIMGAAKEPPVVSPHWWPREKTVAYCRAHRGETADGALTAAANARERPGKLEWIDNETSPAVQRRKMLAGKC